MQSTANASAKHAARELLDQPPDSISWNEIAYCVEVRASIERGMQDAREGRTFTHEEVKKRFGITD